MIGLDGIVQRQRLAAYAWCEADDRVLLWRIAPGEADSGRWTLPGGGLEFGEDPADGVLRELEEETGLRGRIVALAGILSGVTEPHETASGHRLQLIGILYRVTATGGELRDETDNSTDRAAWVPFAELDALPVVDLVRWARGQMGR